MVFRYTLIYSKTPSVTQPRAFLMRYVVFGIGLRVVIISIILCFVNVLLLYTN
nr:MAG TPA: hypothetical protein [Caudoviricetes sp.]